MQVRLLLSALRDAPAPLEEIEALAEDELHERNEALERNHHELRVGRVEMHRVELHRNANDEEEKHDDRNEQREATSNDNGQGPAAISSSYRATCTVHTHTVQYVLYEEHTSTSTVYVYENDVQYSIRTVL